MSMRTTASSPPPARNYIRTVGQFEPFSAAEEVRLCSEYQRTRDPRLGRRLAEHNLRLVITIAAPFARSSGMPIEDLVQEGSVGLMEAVGRFDPRRGVRFGSYAPWWIRAFILKYLLDNARLVRAGRSRADRRAFFRGEANPRELSLDATVVGNDVGNGVPLMDVLTDGEQPRVDRLLEEAEIAALARREAIAYGRTLSGREADVFATQVLREDSGGRTLLATRHRVSRERVRQIEKKLLEGLRHHVGTALGMN